MVMLNVIMLITTMVSAIILSVVMLSGAAPQSRVGQVSFGQLVFEQISWNSLFPRFKLRYCGLSCSVHWSVTINKEYVDQNFSELKFVIERHVLDTSAGKQQSLAATDV
jgi:hypothetical protein